MFADALSGDFHLIDSADATIDKGTSLVTDDSDCEYRDDLPDLGADEYSIYTNSCIQRSEVCGNDKEEDCDGKDPICVCSSVDINKDNIIDLNEINLEIGRWNSGTRSMALLIRAIREWKKGY